jgi:hypothetical protein
LLILCMSSGCLLMSTVDDSSSIRPLQHQASHQPLPFQLPTLSAGRKASIESSTLGWELTIYLMSPMPSSLEMKDLALNGSRSSKCSPVPYDITHPWTAGQAVITYGSTEIWVHQDVHAPRKTMGALVAATADRAPPPLAWPSSLVITTEPGFRGHMETCQAVCELHYARMLCLGSRLRCYV